MPPTERRSALSVRDLLCANVNREGTPSANNETHLSTDTRTVSLPDAHAPSDAPPALPLPSVITRSARSPHQLRRYVDAQSTSASNYHQLDMPLYASSVTVDRTTAQETSSSGASRSQDKHTGSPDGSDYRDGALNATHQRTHLGANLMHSEDVHNEVAPSISITQTAGLLAQNSNRLSPYSNGQDSFEEVQKPSRGPWRIEEDKLLIELVNKHGARHWSAIAQHFPRRSGKQARERWMNQLNPNLKKKNWSPEEDKIILQAHAELGNKWSAIAQWLPGRTDNSVKNRFNSTLRRAMRERSQYSAHIDPQELVDSLHAKPYALQKMQAVVRDSSPQMYSAHTCASTPTFLANSRQEGPLWGEELQSRSIYQVSGAHEFISKHGSSVGLHDYGSHHLGQEAPLSPQNTDAVPYKGYTMFESERGSSMPVVYPQSYTPTHYQQPSLTAPFSTPPGLGLREPALTPQHAIEGRYSTINPTSAIDMRGPGAHLDSMIRDSSYRRACNPQNVFRLPETRSFLKPARDIPFKQKY